MSVIVSCGLFISSVLLYARKAGRHRLWLVIMLALLISFLLLNAVLFASDYFTGNGITDAVVYTLTSNLTGAGTAKYMLPAAGLLTLMVAFFVALGWFLRKKIISTIWAGPLRPACWRPFRLRPALPTIR